MTSFDPKKNFAISTVLVAPTPALTGTSLQVAVGEGALFPVTGAGQAFNAVVWPANAPPTVANAEIVRVVRVGDAFAITRTQEGSGARAIQVGDRIMQGITAKALTDIEAALATAAGAIILTAQPILEPGVSGQVSRGRVLVAADFTTLLGLTAPVAGYNLSDLTDFSGNARSLTNKGAVAFGSGIMGAATEAAIFTGSTGQALYVVDTGAADPFRIPYGSWGCWFRTAKTGTQQYLMAKAKTTPSYGWFAHVTAGGVVAAEVSVNGTSTAVVAGVSTVTDDRWHFGVCTYDGTAVSVYVDGALETVANPISGPLFSAVAPFNIGGYGADGAVVASVPFFGRVDEAFVTQDVLSPDQVRALYAAKVAHGFGALPIGAKVSVRRLRKGAALASGIFSTAPLHLYNLTAGALTDAGSLNNPLTNNGAAVVAPAPDGAQGNAFNFIRASTQYLSATDAGLPAARTTRSVGVWLKSLGVGSNEYAVAYGTAAASACFTLGLDSTNHVFAGDTGTPLASPATYGDGQWHFAVVTYDDAAGDGLRIKLYVDGKLVASATTQIVSTTLAGANAFRVGSFVTAGNEWTGQLDAPFVTGYAMSADEVAKLYAQGSQSLGVSPKNAGDHVEAMDATNVYLVADSLDSQYQFDLEVTA